MSSATQIAARTQVDLESLPRAHSRRRRWRLYALAVDLVALGTVEVATLVLRSADTRSLPALWTLAGAGITLGVLALRGRYRVRMRSGALDDVASTAVGALVASAILLGIRGMSDGGWVDLAPGLRFWVLATTFLVAGRIGFATSASRSREARAGLPTLIVGAGHVGRLVAQRLRTNTDIGLMPIGFLDKEPTPLVGGGPLLPVLGASWDLERIVADYGVEYVIVTFSTAPTSVLLDLIRRCESLGVEVALVPRLFETVPRRLHVEHLGGVPILEVAPSNPRGWQFAVKHAADRAGALLLMPLVAPVLLVCAVAVRISLGRPVFFRQARVGRDGRVFEMVKFRSMRETDAPAAPSPQQTLSLAEPLAPGGVEGSDRRTRLGAFLRRTSLDELPQLLNVLRGEMSFVGPRPERPEFARQFDESVYRYGARHRVKSGITGWAQVNGLRGKTSIGDRAEWDNYYIENWSFGLDLKILLLTARAVLRPGGAVE